MSRLRGVAKRLKQETDTHTLRMQFFHLDPTWKNYQGVISCTKLCMEQAHVIDIWKLGCLVEYGEYWADIHWDAAAFEQAGGEDTPISVLNPDIRGALLHEYSTAVNKLMGKVLERPTPTLLDQLWYSFFATGSYEFLEAAFEVAGNRRAKPGLRDDAVTMYELIREQYAEKIADAKDRKADYFEAHELPNVRRAESVWKKLAAMISGANDELVELGDDDEEEKTNQEIEALLAENKKYEFVSNADAKYMPEQRARKKKLEKAMGLFEDILVRINKEDKDGAD